VNFFRPCRHSSLLSLVPLESFWHSLRVKKQTSKIINSGRALCNQIKEIKNNTDTHNARGNGVRRERILKHALVVGSNQILTARGSEGQCTSTVPAIHDVNFYKRRILERKGPCRAFLYANDPVGKNLFHGGCAVKASNHTDPVIRSACLVYF